MNAKLITVQKRIALILVDKIETSQMNLSRAGEIARTILYLLPEDSDDSVVDNAIPKLEAIPEIHGFSIGINL